MPIKIIIILKSGLVEDVIGIPENIEVEVRDYDCSEQDKDIWRDELDDPYLLTSYHHNPNDPVVII